MQTPSPGAGAPSTSPRQIAEAADVGPIVRARRHAQALRIDDAAALTGVSVDLMSRLENGKGSVRLDKLLAVLDGLGLALVVAPKDGPWMRSIAAAIGPDPASARSTDLA